MEPIWKKHWPATVDEKSIRLPEEVLPVILARQAKLVPDRTAIQFYGREIRFKELDEAVGRFAGFLKSRGLAPGDRVAIYLENSPQFAIAYYATLRAGGIAVCLNPMHKAVELSHEFEDSGARGAKSNVECDALLLNEESRTDTYPYIEVDEDSASVGHEARVSRVNDDLTRLYVANAQTGWVAQNFITDDTEVLAAEANQAANDAGVRFAQYGGHLALCSRRREALARPLADDTLTANDPRRGPRGGGPLPARGRRPHPGGRRPDLPDPREADPECDRRYGDRSGCRSGRGRCPLVNQHLPRHGSQLAPPPAGASRKPERPP